MRVLGLIVGVLLIASTILHDHTLFQTAASVVGAVIVSTPYMIDRYRRLE